MFTDPMLLHISIYLYYCLPWIFELRKTYDEQILFSNFMHKSLLDDIYFLHCDFYFKRIKVNIHKSVWKRQHLQKTLLRFNIFEIYGLSSITDREQLETYIKMVVFLHQDLFSDFIWIKVLKKKTDTCYDVSNISENRF